MLIQAETLSWPETCYKACSRGALSSEYFLTYLAIFHLCSVFNTLKKKPWNIEEMERNRI